MVRIVSGAAAAGEEAAAIPPSHFTSVRYWLFGRRAAEDAGRRATQDIPVFRFLNHFDDNAVTELFLAFREYVRLHQTPEVVLDYSVGTVEAQCDKFLALGKKVNTLFDSAFSLEERVYTVASHYYTSHLHEVHAFIFIPVSAARTEG